MTDFQDIDKLIKQIEFTLFDVTLFRSDGVLYHTARDIPRDDAWSYAERHRPRCGSSYVVLAGTELKFRARWPTRHYRPRYPSLNRTTCKQMLQVRDRFLREGDAANAVVFTQLIYDMRMEADAKR